MPYRARGMTVYKQQDNGEWVIEKRHTSKAKAKAHASALNIAVHAPEKARDDGRSSHKKKGSYHDK